MKNTAGMLLVALLVGGATREFAATNGLVNFRKVNDSQYRGGQPDYSGMKQLQALGVKSVVNLRMTNDLWEAETAAAIDCSMAYTNIPLNSLTAPTDAQVAHILAAIEQMPKPVFVHCQYGCDRTGTIIACYRIRHDRWSNIQALKEAYACGLSPLEVEMRQYILHFRK